MEIVKISPRGYCYGVVDAMVLALQTAKNLELPRPIYILGMIVHNAHVTDAFEKEGVITLDGANRLEILDQIQEGTVIFTAHGVSPEVRQLARAKGLSVVDATCPDVTKTHDLIRDKTAEGYHIIYIGKKITLSLKVQLVLLRTLFISSRPKRKLNIFKYRKVALLLQIKRRCPNGIFASL